jgi:hypothetical protein
MCLFNSSAEAEDEEWDEEEEEDFYVERGRGRGRKSQVDFDPTINPKTGGWPRQRLGGKLFGMPQSYVRHLRHALTHIGCCYGDQRQHAPLR